MQETSPARPSRLSTIVGDAQLAPWRRAWELKTCALYWLPVSAFPLPDGQRLWLQRFLADIETLFASAFGLRPYDFLQVRPLTGTLLESFQRQAVDLTAVIGAGWTRVPIPREVPPAVPRELTDAVRKLLESPELVAWFPGRHGKPAREQFLGHGFAAMAFFPPDPATVPPELPLPGLIRQAAHPSLNFETFLADGCALQDGFQAKTVELYSDFSKTKARGAPFIFPLLDSQDFFSLAAEDLNRFLDVFAVYLIESPADEGVIMATRHDLDKSMKEILKRMREEGISYRA